MKNNKLKKNDITLIKDALIVKYAGVSDKRPLPYIIMFESKNYCIGYLVTSKQGKGQRVGRILISSNYLANKTHSFIKLRDPMVLLKNTKNKRIGKLEPNERSFIIHNIANNRINREILRKQFSYQKNLKDNSNK